MGKGFVDIGNFNSDAYNFPVGGEDKGTIESVDGNVITINFNSDTKGTA